MISKMTPCTVFQLPQQLESTVAADVNLRALIVTEYTDSVNLLSCYRGLKQTRLLPKTCTNNTNRN